MRPDAADVHEALVMIEERLADLEAALSAERLEVERLKRAASNGRDVPEVERILGREPYLEARSNGELEPVPVGSIPSAAEWRAARNPRWPASTNAELRDENEALRDEVRRFELDRDGWRTRYSALEAQLRDEQDATLELVRRCEAAIIASNTRAAQIVELEGERDQLEGRITDVGWALDALERTPVGDVAIVRNAIANVRRALEAGVK